jgi:hypothetical protein
MSTNMRMMWSGLASLGLLLCGYTATAQSGGGQPLFGRWTGERPTDGYIWHFRYQLELIPVGDGKANFGVPHRYKYTVQQISPRRPFWTMTQTGTFILRPSDSNQWKIMMEFLPDQGSEGPPTEADRIALVDNIGLPDDHRRVFRVRNLNGDLYFQLENASPRDGLDRVWRLQFNN